MGKNLSRIKKFIKGAEERGYRWAVDFKLKLFQKPESELSSISSTDLYEDATAINPETGDIVSGTEYKHIENSNRSKKAAETRKARQEAESGEASNEATTAFYNVYYDFIAKMHQPIEEYYIDPKGRELPRWKALVEITKMERDFILNVVSTVASQPNGIETMGYRILEAGEDFIDALIQQLYKSSTQQQVYEASAKIIETLIGRGLTSEESLAFHEQVDSNAGLDDEYEDFDDEIEDY